MQFGTLLSETWATTWRNRRLWLYGLFAGSVGGACLPSAGGNFNMDSATRDEIGWDEVVTQFNRALTELQGGIAEYWSVIVVALAVLALIWLAFLILAVACQTLLMSATADEVLARSKGPRRVGGRLSAFFRLLVQRLLLTVIHLAVVGAVVVAAVQSLLARREADPLVWLSSLIAPFVLLGLLYNVVLVIDAFAQRAVVIDGAGPLQGIAQGCMLFVKRLGASLAIWLLNVVAGIIGGLGMAVVLFLALIPAAIVGGLVGVLALALGGSDAATVAGFGVGGLCWLVILLVCSAGFNTFLWNYWTIAYLRLTGRGLEEPSSVPLPVVP